MTDVISQGMAYRKAIATKLYERADIQNLRGLDWDTFLKELVLLPVPVKLDRIIACDIFDLLNPVQKDTLVSEQN